jgi:C4-dicarboxylate-specific signal transduction histidine kinase
VLQSVYSTVGILLERLPNTLGLERRLAGDLKSRAELCKIELDAIVELVAPLAFRPGRIDLAATVQTALMQARRRFANLQIHFEGSDPVHVEADGRVLSASLVVLLLAVCQGARHQVRVRVQPDAQKAECVLERDGHAATAEQLAWLEKPFSTTQHVLFGIGLALVQRAVQPLGGTVTAANRQEEGISVRIMLPLAAQAG